MSKPLFNRLALLGIGLIGSSIALRVRRDRIADHVAVWTRRRETLDRAAELDLGDSYHEVVADAVAGADLIIACVPVGASADVAQAMAPHLVEGAIISDVGSVKAAVIRQMEPHMPAGVHLVPAHPVAGTERSGPDAGLIDLFDDRWCILTPLAGGDAGAVDRLAAFWRACGSQIEVMDAVHHDLVLAMTSHLPHLIAYNIVRTADDLETVTEAEVIKFSAGGFRDFTRLAASDPTMWRDVFLNNREAVLETLGRFSEDLAALQRAIRWGDGESLFDLFARTRAIRREIIEAGQEVDVPDFGRHPTSD